MAEAKTKATAQTLPFDRTLFTIGLGTKGARAKMGGNVSFDAKKLPAHINSFIYERGADILLRQASQEAEKVQIDEWLAKPAQKARKLTKDDVRIATFPFDFARLERDAVQAMEKRLKQWEAGALGRSAAPMNALDRRAAELIEAGLRTAFAQAKRAAPDAAEMSALVASVLSHPEKGKVYREEAERQLLAAREAVAKSASGLADFIGALPEAQTA